jgi:hypothetical protein
VSFRRHAPRAISSRNRGFGEGIPIAPARAVLRIAALSLALAGCITSNGRVNVAASTGVLGGALIVGGATIGAGSCQPSPEQCERIERGSPVATGVLVLAGAGLIGLAWLFHESDSR